MRTTSTCRAKFRSGLEFLRRTAAGRRMLTRFPPHWMRTSGLTSGSLRFRRGLDWRRLAGGLDASSVFLLLACRGNRIWGSRTGDPEPWRWHFVPRGGRAALHLLALLACRWHCCMSCAGGIAKKIMNVLQVGNDRHLSCCRRCAFRFRAGCTWANFIRSSRARGAALRLEGMDGRRQAIGLRGCDAIPHRRSKLTHTRIAQQDEQVGHHRK